MNEEQLEDYIIDRGQSKSNYFLLYRNEHPAKLSYDVVNNPLNSQHFIKRLHTSVKEKERQYYRLEGQESEEEEEEEEEEQSNKNKEKKEVEEKKKEYFGQFKKVGKAQKIQAPYRV